MIELSGIDKFYADGAEQKHVLKNICMTVSEGDFISVCGTSGCGKTTLLNILGLLDTFDSGEYIFDGQSMADLKEKEMTVFRNSHIGFVFQDFMLIQKETVFFNVALPLYFSKKPLRISRCVCGMHLRMSVLKICSIKRYQHCRADKSRELRSHGQS